MITLRSSVDTVYDETGGKVVGRRTKAKVKFPGTVLPSTASGLKGLVPTVEPGMVRVSVHVNPDETVDYELYDELSVVVPTLPKKE